MRTPGDVVEAAFAAININDWHAFAELFEPLSLAVFKRQTLRFLKQVASDFDDDDDLEFDYTSGIESSSAQDWFLRHELCGVESMAELETMDPARVFVRWIQAQSLSKCSREADGSDDTPASNEPVESRTILSYRYTILGSVQDAHNTAFVLAQLCEPVPDEDPLANIESYASWSEEERRFLAAMYVRGEPLVLECRRVPDGSWRIVAKRSLFIRDSVEVVSVRP